MFNKIQSVASIYGATQPTAVRRTRQESAPEARDEVVISAAGQSFSDMLRELKDTPEVRPEKVDYYTQAIESGSYHVDAHDIAQKMLDLRF